MNRPAALAAAGYLVAALASCWAVMVGYAYLQPEATTRRIANTIDRAQAARLGWTPVDPDAHAAAMVARQLAETDARRRHRIYLASGGRP